MSSPSLSDDRFTFMAECVDCHKTYRFATRDARYGWLHRHPSGHDVETYQEERP